jgi:hypothetical protein
MPYNNEKHKFQLCMVERGKCRKGVAQKPKHD